jgi:hypothetical protein
MIELTDTALGVLAGSYRYFIRVESWRRGELLADDVPILSGTEHFDRALRVPQRVELSIPRTSPGYSWVPDTDDHPLANWGQRLKINLGVGLGHGNVEWFTRGEFLIVDSEGDGDEVTVSAANLLSLIEEARLVSPYQPAGTLKSAVRGLVEPALTVIFDPALVDRAVPTLQFEEDRLTELWSVLDAWPADATVTPDGYLYVHQVEEIDGPTSATASLNAVTIRTGAGADREGAANAVVARGTAADGGQVQGVAYDTLPTSPTWYGGPFNPLPVPEYFYSPLLTTVAQCATAARTILWRRQRRTMRPFTLKCTPQPHLQPGDVVETRDNRVCIIEAGQLPLTPGQGEMTLTLREVWWL